MDDLWFLIPLSSFRQPEQDGQYSGEINACNIKPLAKKNGPPNERFVKQGVNKPVDPFEISNLIPFYKYYLLCSDCQRQHSKIQMFCLHFTVIGQQTAREGACPELLDNLPGQDLYSNPFLT